MLKGSLNRLDNRYVLEISIHTNVRTKSTFQIKQVTKSNNYNKSNAPTCGETIWKLF